MERGWGGGIYICMYVCVCVRACVRVLKQVTTCVCVCVCVKASHNLGRTEVLRISGCICSVKVSDTTN